MPSKIRCDRAIAVSSGLPIVLVSSPLPPRRPLGSSSRVPSGCMKTSTPSSSHLAQKGWNFGSASSSAGDAAADADPLEAELLHGVLDLLGRQLGMLQGGRGEGDEAVGVGGAELDQRLVLDPDQFGRDVAFGLVPVGIDAQRLDVDALGVHRRDPRAGIVHQQARRLQRLLEERHRLRHAAMGVDVDGPDPPAGDHDLAPARMGMVVGVPAPVGGAA